MTSRPKYYAILTRKSDNVFSTGKAEVVIEGPSDFCEFLIKPTGLKYGKKKQGTFSSRTDICRLVGDVGDKAKIDFVALLNIIGATPFQLVNSYGTHKGQDVFVFTAYKEGELEFTGGYKNYDGVGGKARRKKRGAKIEAEPSNWYGMLIGTEAEEEDDAEEEDFKSEDEEEVKVSKKMAKESSASAPARRRTSTVQQKEKSHKSTTKRSGNADGDKASAKGGALDGISAALGNFFVGAEEQAGSDAGSKDEPKVSRHHSDDQVAKNRRGSGSSTVAPGTSPESQVHHSHAPHTRHNAMMGYGPPPGAFDEPPQSRSFHHSASPRMHHHHHHGASPARSFHHGASPATGRRATGGVVDYPYNDNSPQYSDVNSHTAPHRQNSGYVGYAPPRGKSRSEMRRSSLPAKLEYENLRYGDVNGGQPDIRYGDEQGFDDGYDHHNDQYNEEFEDYDEGYARDAEYTNNAYGSGRNGNW